MFGYSWVREGQNGALMRAILDGMRAFDVEIEALHTETGPGVYEAAIRYDDCLRAADKAALFKTAMKQIAFDHGLTVTFMAKWNAELPGASGHIHQSLWQGGKNVFAAEGDPNGLSKTMRHYSGGPDRAHARADGALSRPPSTATSATCPACGRRSPRAGDSKTAPAPSA